MKRTCFLHTDCAKWERLFGPSVHVPMPRPKKKRKAKKRGGSR